MKQDNLLINKMLHHISLICYHMNISNHFFKYIIKFPVLPLFLMCLFKHYSCNAEIIFNDTFQNELNSRLSWIFPNQIETSTSFTDNGVKLINKHPYNSMIALHSLDQKPSLFTMKVDIDSAGPGSGIFFNVNTDNHGRYNGYAAVISYGKVELIKYHSGSISTISSVSSPFIRPSKNELSISKHDDCILLFCNGYFISSVYENELPSGNCALITQPTSQAIFSYFELNSQLKDSLQFSDFKENFNTNDGFGWKKNGNGIVEIKNTMLNIVTGKYQSCNYGIEHPLLNYSLSTVVKWDVGNDSTLYGLYIATTNSNKSQNPGYYKFGINRNGKCVFIDTADSIILDKTFQAAGDLSKTLQSDWNTLKIIQTDSIISCFINDTKILETIRNEQISGAGIFAKQGLNIYFDSFELKYINTNSSTATNSIKQTYKINKKEFHNAKIFTDLMGRKIIYSSDHPLKITPTLILNNYSQHHLNFP